jgi:hypothetical protein
MWWPHFDQPIYTAELPIWSPDEDGTPATAPGHPTSQVVRQLGPRKRGVITTMTDQMAPDVLLYKVPDVRCALKPQSVSGVRPAAYRPGRVPGAV